LGPKPVCQEIVLPKIMDHSQEVIGIADRPTPPAIPAPSR
jgi:hypothetical protein